MANAWIITTDSHIKEPLARARELGGTVTAIAVGADGINGVDRTIQIEVAEGIPAEAYAPAVVEAIDVADGDVVLAKNGPTERIFACAVAAAKGLPVLLGLKSLASGSAELSRYGGISDETVSFSSAVVAVVEGGGASEGDAPAAETASGSTYNAKVAFESGASGDTVDLASAKRIVAVGRGFKAEEDLQLARDLASTIDAQLACSRPIAEGSGWMGHDTYIGISGQHVAPEVFIAVGISGQIQHTAGMDKSKTIIVVNNDESAAMFEMADYGVVGDLYDVLPALNDALK